MTPTPNEPSAEGKRVVFENGEIKVPSNPIIPFIEGDGIGPDIWRAASRVLDAAVEVCFRGERKLCWTEAFAGEKAHVEFGE